MRSFWTTKWAEERRSGADCTPLEHSECCGMRRRPACWISGGPSISFAGDDLPVRFPYDDRLVATVKLADAAAVEDDGRGIAEVDFARHVVVLGKFQPTVIEIVLHMRLAMRDANPRIRPPSCHRRRRAADPRRR